MAYKETPNGGGSHKADRGPAAPKVVKREVPHLAPDANGLKPKTVLPITNLFTNPTGRGAVQGGGTSKEALQRAKRNAKKKGNGKGGK